MRVRHAALRTLGQITLDFTDPNAVDTVSAGPEVHAASAGRSSKLKPIQQVAGDILLPVFIRGMGPDNAMAPRIQAVTAACVVNFAHPSECNTEDFGTFLSPLLQALLQLLQNTKSMGVCVSCKVSR